MLTDRKTSQPFRCTTTGLPIERRHIMRRAWVLARCNRRNRTAPFEIGKWLRVAWDEARRGDTRFWEFFSHQHRIDWLETNRLVEIHKARLADIDWGFIRRAEAEVVTLKARIAAGELAAA